MRYGMVWYGHDIVWLMIWLRHVILVWWVSYTWYVTYYTPRRMLSELCHRAGRPSPRCPRGGRPRVRQGRPLQGVTRGAGFLVLRGFQHDKDATRESQRPQACPSLSRASARVYEFSLSWRSTLRSGDSRSSTTSRTASSARSASRARTRSP